MEPAVKKRRIPKPMTPRRLRNITMYYLEQRTTTRGNLRRVLMNRIRKSLYHHEGDEAEMAGWVDTLLDQLVQQGLINDRAWATSRMNRLLRQGQSARAIRSKLLQKQVSPELIDELLAQAAPDPLAGAAKAMKRRGIGCFREPHRQGDPKKDLAKLVRAGFSYDIARRALSLEEDEALELVWSLRDANY